MTKAKNTPIGEVRCPMTGCGATCKVYAFRPRSEGRRTVFTDKLYAECPTHGRLGSDGNPATSDYIRKNATLWEINTDSEAPDASQKNPAPSRTPALPRSQAPAPPRSRQAPAPAHEPEKPRSGWRTLLD